MVKNLAQQGLINLSGLRPQLAKGPTKTLQDQGFYDKKKTVSQKILQIFHLIPEHKYFILKNLHTLKINPYSAKR